MRNLNVSESPRARDGRNTRDSATPKTFPGSKNPSDSAFEKAPERRVGHPDAVTGVHLQLWRQMQVDARDQEVLLIFDARQMRQRANLAIVLQRRLQPSIDRVAHLARWLEGHSLMRARPAEGLVEREVPDDEKRSEVALRNRHQVQLQWRIGGIAAHVLELHVGAKRHRPAFRKGHPEMDLGAR